MDIKRFLFIILLFVVCNALPAPGLRQLTIIASKSISPYEHLFRVIGNVESNNDPSAYCIDANGLPSIGIVQIQKIRVDDYNRCTGEKIAHKQCFSYAISRKIFMYYACRYQPWEHEKIAKHWNGLGKINEAYWKKVKERL
jgi:hypothetical protein